jgi:hypothetical protein
MNKNMDPDLARIKELWPILPWWLKKKIFFTAIYFLASNRIIRAWETINFAWIFLMLQVAESLQSLANWQPWRRVIQPIKTPAVEAAGAQEKEGINPCRIILH